VKRSLILFRSTDLELGHDRTAVVFGELEIKGVSLELVREG
jgi:hypothetical protein